jgi:hypothetical protein
LVRVDRDGDNLTLTPQYPIVFVPDYPPFNSYLPGVEAGAMSHPFSYIWISQHAPKMKMFVIPFLRGSWTDKGAIMTEDDLRLMLLDWLQGTRSSKRFKDWVFTY